MLSIEDGKVKITYLEPIQQNDNGTTTCKTHIIELTDDDLLLLANHISKLQLAKVSNKIANDSDDTIEDAIY